MNTINRNITKVFQIILLCFFFIFSSCKNELWEEHYNPDLTGKGTISLYELISNDVQLSTFSQMLVKTGYDSILTSSITYTVWAPVNSDELTNALNTYTNDELKLLVQNHISIFPSTTSGLHSKSILMLNQKINVFNSENGFFVFGGNKLMSGNFNIAAKNGILHLIEKPVPYLNNIWEFILKAEGLDSLRNFLLSKSEYIFDKEASAEIGTNSFNQAVYDSVIIFRNEILEKIGAIHNEDSTYSALLPDNKAWKSAFNLISNKYKAYSIGSDGKLINDVALQRLNTQKAIVNNLIFKSVIPDQSDSVFSTTGNLFKQPGYLFTGLAKNKLSNGVAFIADSLRFKASDSWQKAIKIEAENADFGRSNLFSNLFIRSGQGTSFSTNVSDYRYLLIEPRSVSASEPASVTFRIPNVLSGKYKVYCVFIPSSIVLNTDLRPYKVKFYFTYRKADGVLFENSPVSAAYQLQTTNRTAAIFTTTANAVSKMFVTEIEFPYSNLYTPGTSTTNISTMLKVENATTTVEEVQKKGDRKVRIDYLILEPVL